MNMHHGTIVFEVKDCNPNGDPNTDMPRQSPDRRGWISAECIKRRSVRDVLAETDTPEFDQICQMFEFDPDQIRIFESRQRGYKDMEPVEAKEAAMKLLEEDPEAAFDRFVDIRMFGTTALDSGGEKDGKTKHIRTGAIQITPARSLRPVTSEVASIVKSYPLRDKLLKDGHSNPCPDAKKMVMHGLYICHYFITPGMAVKTRLTDEDIELFKFLASRTFSWNRSATRTGVSVVQMIHLEHNSPINKFSENKFKQMSRPTIIGDPSVGSSSLMDYQLADVDQIRSAVGDDGTVEEVVA